MATILVLAIVLASMTGGASGAGQPVPLHPSREQIIAAIGNETDAQAVFRSVFAHAFARGPRHDLLAGQVRPIWLPTISGVELSLISDDQARSLAGTCGTYWIVQNAERSGSEVSIRLHRQCTGTTFVYTVSFDGQSWRLGPSGCCANGGGWSVGIGSGYVGDSPADCRCEP